MGCDVSKEPAAAFRHPLLKGVFELFVLGLSRRPVVGRLDLEATPDRIKRDLGFLDGRDPRQEEPLRR